MISPGEFIPVAEHCGLIGPIDRYVLEQACQQIAMWGKARRDIRVAVNLSAAAFQSESLAADVSAVLRHTGASPEMLELEITEYALITDINLAIEKLKAVRDLGVRVALDDFGTGYSSMAYLRRLPLDVLKVDQSFVRDIERDRNAAAIVRAIITMARALDLHVVAEGVETPGQLEFVQEHGGDVVVQGWIYSPAVPAARMDALLEAAVLAPAVPKGTAA